MTEKGDRQGLDRHGLHGRVVVLPGDRPGVLATLTVVPGLGR